MLFWKHLKQKISLKEKKGVTLTEVMITVAIMGLIFSLTPQFFVYSTRFTRMNNAREEIQRDVRMVTDLVRRNIRQAQSETIVIDTAPGQPPFSRIAFTTIKDDEIQYFQRNRELVEQKGTRQRVLLRNLRFVSFSLPQTDNTRLASFTISLEKATYQGESKAIQMNVNKIEIKN